MNTKKTLQKTRLLAVTLILIALITVSSFALISTASCENIGYLQGTQGLDFRFYVLNWKGEYWSETLKGSPTYDSQKPTQRSFGYTLGFDPDDASWGMPNLSGSFGAFTTGDKPDKTYSWNLPNSDGSYTTFEMYRYKCSFSVNLWMSGTEKEADGYEYGVPFGHVSPNYGSSEIWLKITPRSFVYFDDNPDQVYFAPVSISLKENVVFAGTDKNGKAVNKAELNNIQSTNPSAQGDMLGIWYSAQNKIDENTLLSYKGHRLDSQIFQKEYYTRINLDNFQTLSEWGPWWHNWYFPSVQMNFDVYIYVIGEWKTFQTPSDYPVHLPSPVSHGSWDAIALFFDQLAFDFGLGFNMGWVIWVFIALIAIFIIWWMLNHRSNSGKTSSSRTHNSSATFFGMRLTDLLPVGILTLLVFVPDPVDLLTGGLPGIEALVDIFFVYRAWKNRSTEVSKP